MNKFYSRLYKLLAGLIRKVYRIEIVGKENEPTDGPFLVCANHISNQDVVILAASLKHQVRFLAKAELFKVPLLGRLIRALGAYPVERGKGDVGAIKNTLKLLDAGEVVGIYPQGHRFAGVHPCDTEVKGGVGLVLTKKQIPVLPVAIQTRKFKVLMFFKKTKVIIGKPVYFDAPLEIVGKKNDFYNEVTAEVFTKICELFDENAYPQPKNPKFLLNGKTETPRLCETNPMTADDGVAEILEKSKQTETANEAHEFKVGTADVSPESENTVKAKEDENTEGVESDAVTENENSENGERV